MSFFAGPQISVNFHQVPWVQRYLRAMSRGQAVIEKSQTSWLESERINARSRAWRRISVVVVMGLIPMLGTGDFLLVDLRQKEAHSPQRSREWGGEYE
jgi:hypothetical protein